MSVIRPMSPDDIDLVCHHREQVWRENGRSEEVIASVAQPFREWLARSISGGPYLGWILEEEGQPVGGAGLMEMEWPPHPMHPATDRRGCIMNVYVEPAFRGKGLATLLMDHAVAEAGRRGIQYLVLHASEKGRPLYEKLGWQPTSEMALTIPPAAD